MHHISLDILTSPPSPVVVPATLLPPSVRQSGVVPWRLADHELQVLLVTNFRGRRWLVPKGNIERHLTPQQSALKEAWEEAGVDGHVDEAPLGCFRLDRRRRRRGLVCLYAMQVLAVQASWKEMNKRERRWASIEEAMELVRSDGLRVCLQRMLDIAAPLRLAA